MDARMPPGTRSSSARAEPARVRVRLGPSIGWVLVADDDPSWTKLLRSRLGDLVPIRVAHDVRQARALVHQPGLVAAIVDGVLDHKADLPDGVDDVAIPAKRLHPDAQICVMSSACDMAALRRAQRAGCLIATKDLPIEEVRRMAKEWRSIVRVTDAATERIERDLHDFMSRGVLTVPQAEHVRLAARGVSYVAIARELECSRQSVEAMSRRVQQSTGLTTMALAHELCRGTSRLPASDPSPVVEALRGVVPTTATRGIVRADFDVG